MVNTFSIAHPWAYKRKRKKSGHFCCRIFIQFHYLHLVFLIFDWQTCVTSLRKLENLPAHYSFHSTSNIHFCLFAFKFFITVYYQWWLILFRFLESAWSSWCLVWEVPPTRDGTLTVAKDFLCGQEAGNWLCTCHGWFWIPKWSFYSCLWWYCGLLWVWGYNIRGIGMIIVIFFFSI